MGRVLAGAAALIVLALLVGDVAARHWTEAKLAQAIDQNMAGSHATVHVSSFPFLGRLAASGSVRRLTAHVDHLSTHGLDIAYVDVEVDGATVDRNALIQSRQVKVQRIDHGMVRAVITEAALSHAVGATVKLGEGTVQVTERGVTVAARVAVVNDRLVVAGPLAVPLGVAIPTSAILPCVAAAAAHTARLEVSCQISAIPPALLTR